MKLYIDIDSAVFKAGCSNETRSYLVFVEDQVVYECQYKKEAQAFLTENDIRDAELQQIKTAGPLADSLHNTKLIVESILDCCDHSFYKLYLGGDGNFRYDIYEDYKRNRDPMSRPTHERQIREYLLDKYNTELVHGEEADDRISYLGLRDQDKVMVSIDKDLQNTPGLHYNYDKKEFTWIEEDIADLNFYQQLLTGDSSDNIPGLPKVGKKTAEEILPHPVDNMEEICYNQYLERGFDKDYFVMNAQLLWIRREPEQIWRPTVC